MKSANGIGNKWQFLEFLKDRSSILNTSEAKFTHLFKKTGPFEVRYDFKLFCTLSFKKVDKFLSSEIGILIALCKIPSNLPQSEKMCC